MKNDDNWNAVISVAIFFILVGTAVFIIQSTNNKVYKNETNTKEEKKEVKISEDKIVDATGFEDSSNYKYYLKDGNLYYKYITTEEEEIIATGVKDLYLEDGKVTAELSGDGKIVKENNYVTYK